MPIFETMIAKSASDAIKQLKEKKQRDFTGPYRQIRITRSIQIDKSDRWLNERGLRRYKIYYERVIGPKRKK